MALYMGYNEKAKHAALLARLSTKIQQALVVPDLANFLETVIAKI